jgi:hypothetical protein
VVALLLVSVAGSAIVAPAPAAAGIFFKTLLECTDEAATEKAVRGVAICFETSTRIDGGTVDDGDYELRYEYRVDPEEFPTIRIVKKQGEIEAGTEVSLDIIYPNKTDGIYVGDQLADTSFVLVAANEFDFVKTFVDANGDEVAKETAVGIRYKFDFELAEITKREGCEFADTSGDFPFPAAPICDDDSDVEPKKTSSFVADTVTFWHEAFGFSAADGGFVNSHGTSLIVRGSPGIDGPADIRWQIVGPKFNVAGDRNIGTAQVFLAAAHRELIFGADFEVSGTSGVAVDRQDRQDAEAEVETVSVLNEVIVTDLRGGLLITIEEYGFPAPAFQVGASGQSDSGAQSGASAPDTSVAMSCEGTRAVGSEVTCTVSGGDAGIDILWQAAYNPVFASAGVTLDADGNGTFSFAVPPAALGQELTVELVAWLSPASLGVVGGPVPASVPAGGGPVPVWPFVMLTLAGGPIVARRSRVASPALPRG